MFMSLHFSETNCVLLASPEHKRIYQNYLEHSTHVMFGNYWQLYTSKCYPGSCSWVTGPEKIATKFKDTAPVVLEMMFHLFKEGKDNRNYIYIPHK